MCNLQIFSSWCVFAFSQYNSFFCRAKVYHFDDVQIILFSFMEYAFDIYARTFSLTQSHKEFFSFTSFQKFYFLVFSRPMVHFELVFWIWCEISVKLSLFFLLSFSFVYTGVPAPFLERSVLSQWPSCLCQRAIGACLLPSTTLGRFLQLYHI